MANSKPIRIDELIEKLVDITKINSAHQNDVEIRVVELKQKFRDLGKPEPEEAESLRQYLEKALDSFKNSKKCSENEEKFFMEILLDTYKQQQTETGSVERREAKGRDRDSGVYSADSRVLSTSNSFVTQPTPDDLHVRTIGEQVEHSEKETDA